MKEIRLTKGFVTLVDDEDYDELSKYNWQFHQGYACRKTFKKDGHHRMYLHVQVVGRVDGLVTDHISGDTLDNRRANLRHVTRAQNGQNCSAKGGYSKYKGVTWYKLKRLWGSQIRVNGKLKYLGLYKQESDAARAYNVAAEQCFGEYARLNVIEESDTEVTKCI